MNTLSRLGTCLLLPLVLVACGGGSDEGGETASGQTKRAHALAAADMVQPPTLTAVWTQLPNPNYAPPAGPYARAWTEMTWDPLRGEVVLFGGNGLTGYENDIWSYNATTTNWTEIDPQVFCPGNYGFSKPNGTDDSNFKYDPVNNLYWVFGANSGYRCLTYATVRQAGNGTTPASLVDPNLPGTTDNEYQNWAVRSGGVEAKVAAYNAGTKTLTLATSLAGLSPGASYQLYATTGAGVWYFDPTTHTWVGQNTPQGNTGPIPGGARIAPAVAYSDADEAFVLFAGRVTDGIDKRVWRLDVRTKLWSQLPLPATTPPHMRELLNSFVYDKQNNVFILFGGVCSSDPSCTEGSHQGQTWAYHLPSNTWTNMNPPSAPSPRAQHVMTYDEANGVTVLYSGASTSGLLGDTWYYHYPSNRWVQVSPTAAPIPRKLAQAAYDPVNGRTMMYGGQSDVGMRNDMWSLKLSPVSGAPTVSLTAPAAGNTYTAPASVVLSASAADADGSVTKVEFFAGATKLGEVTSAPYTLQWNGVAAGSYSLTARATDNAGLTTTSSAVNITVTPPANQAPSATITAPAAGSTYTAPAAFTITAAAADSDGSVAKVEFFDGATKLGETTSAPYSLSVSGLAAGSHSLTVRATDNLGLATTSSAVIITVNSPANQPPTVSLTAPVAGTTYTAPASITLTASAADADGSVAKVEYFAGASKLGETTSAPHSFTWTNVAAGSYSLTARATDNAGATTTSSAVAVTVTDPSGGNPINVALQANGGVASASSTYSAAYPVASVNNGVRTAANWGNGGGWNDASASAYPDWVQITFNGTKSINRVDVFTLADNYASGTQPTSSTTFSLYGLTAFEVQYWNGSAWATVPGGSVTGNTLVWRTISFPAISTDRIRVLVNNSLYWYSRIVEIEAWTAP